MELEILAGFAMLCPVPYNNVYFSCVTALPLADSLNGNVGLGGYCISAEYKLAKLCPMVASMLRWSAVCPSVCRVHGAFCSLNCFPCGISYPYIWVWSRLGDCELNKLLFDKSVVCLASYWFLQVLCLFFCHLGCGMLASTLVSACSLCLREGNAQRRCSRGTVHQYAWLSTCFELDQGLSHA